ncbi:MAG: hypothetical protein MJZ34_09715 [Paludibacteraceae bacterium]|nr:hypothetical protein [Paludibacteraceae bacterium]
MSFFSRLTFLGRMIIISIVVAIIGCALYYSGALQLGIDYYSKQNANTQQTEVVSETTEGTTESAK